ncbi:corrinoid ABC transporter permease [Clostridia bacterium]|nr:corrinoid ABC transporter permease [Clostridia bacterium]
MKFLKKSCMSDKKLLFICVLTLLAAFLLSLGLGAVHLSPPDVLRGIFEGDATTRGRIILHVRLPRSFAALLCGGGLAVSGLIIQTVLANPLASPGILGVNGGAGLAAALCGVILPPLFLPLAAFIGAFATVLLVYAIAKKAGASKMTLILSGVAISSLMTAGINTVVTLFPDALIGTHYFQTGGFAGVSSRVLYPAGAFILVGGLAAYTLSAELDILGLGESTALSLGLNAGVYRFVFLTLAAALAGASVSVAGLLGFVGLIVPHIAKMLTRGSRSLISVSALMGGSFLLLCDTAARTVFAPFEIPVGILVSFLGVPFFLWILFRERRRANA